MGRWVVGDPHGCFLTFKTLVEKLQIKGKLKDSLVVAGDLVDRGPRSMEMVEFVIRNQIPCVRGNHEQMMLDHLNGSPYHDNLWIDPRNGGPATLASYGAGVGRVVDLTPKLKKHIKFLETLPRHLSFPELTNDDGRHLVVTHSGIWHPDFDYAVGSDEIFWNRSMPVDMPGVYNVFGHTPVPHGPIMNKYCANIDTACFYSMPFYQEYGLPKGKLTALHFPSMEIVQQDCID